MPKARMRELRDTWITQFSQEQDAGREEILAAEHTSPQYQ